MTDPDTLRRQHEHLQIQDETVLSETMRLLMSSADGYANAAETAHDDPRVPEWRRIEASRRLLAEQLGAWLTDHGYHPPKEAAPLADVQKAIMMMTVHHVASSDGIQREVAAGDAMLLERMRELSAQADLSPAARDRLDLVRDRVKADGEHPGGVAIPANPPA